MSRIFKALILNDYEGAHYASWVKSGKKPIETRFGKLFSHRGDLVICCGATNSVTENAGKALCIVDLWKGRAMRPGDAEAACIEYHPKRTSHLLRNWRYFSYDFDFRKFKVGGTWQGIFDLALPEDVEIIPQPQILAFPEPVETLFE